MEISRYSHDEQWVIKSKIPTKDWIKREKHRRIFFYLLFSSPALLISHSYEIKYLTCSQMNWPAYLIFIIPTAYIWYSFRDFFKSKSYYCNDNNNINKNINVSIICHSLAQFQANCIVITQSRSKSYKMCNKIYQMQCWMTISDFGCSDGFRCVFS